MLLNENISVVLEIDEQVEKNKNAKNTANEEARNQDLKNEMFVISNNNIRKKFTYDILKSLDKPLRITTTL
jgi:hypothetical protein